MSNTPLECEIYKDDEDYLTCSVHDCEWSKLNRGFGKQCPIARVIELEGEVEDFKNLV